MDKQRVYDHPPQEHMLRDMNMILEYNIDGSATTRIPVAPSVCDSRGAVQAGILATLVDISSGALAAKAAFPDLVVTGDLQMYTAKPARTGEVTAVSSVLRAGRATVIVQSEIIATAEAPVKIGSGISTFYKLSRRDGHPEMVEDVISNMGVSFLSEGPGLSENLSGRAGFRVVDGAAGLVELDMSEYVRNSIGVLEGGMIATLADIAGQCAACAAADKPMITADLSVSYLSQGKTGPFYTKTEVIRRTGDSVLSRVEVFDRGAGDVLMSLAMSTAVAE